MFFSAIPTPVVAEVASAPVAVVMATSTIAVEVPTIEQAVREYFADAPMLIEVARCESTFTHFGKDGKILRGRAVADDLGVMQVNEYYHGKTAKKLGIDIYTLEGNMAYARYLYEKNGLSDWSASKPCWGKSLGKQLAKAN